MNLFGLQEIAETINEFASPEIKEQYLPKMASGQFSGAMVLTEPEAGSDLQAIRLRATYDEGKGGWFLNGVKHFISNGCGDILLVFARSEENIRGGRGLSLFLYEKDENLVVRRLDTFPISRPRHPVLLHDSGYPGCPVLCGSRL